MNKLKRISIIVLISTLMISMNAFGDDFKEPNKPDTDKAFDSGKEKNMEEVASLAAEEALNKLKADDFLSNTALTYKAIHKAFNNRRQEILYLAQLYLMMPLREVVNGETETREKEFLLSKRIFETFPDESAPVLRALYNGGDEVTRGNTIRAAGQVAGGKEVKHLLIEALDDASSYEEMAPDDMGEPLRVCDMAYNQLVLRYSIRNVHRTIGPGNIIEVRDQLIEILKGMIQEGWR